MADYIEKAIGGFCKSHQDSIDSLPFLSPAMKEKAKAWLDDCAAAAGEADTDDKVGAFSQRFEDVRRQLEHSSGLRPAPALPALYRKLTAPA